LTCTVFERVDVIVGHEQNVVLLAQFIEAFHYKWDKVIRNTGKGLIEHEQQVGLIGGTLANEFKEEQFALSPTQTGCVERGIKKE
jgi:hypothetical protein